MLKTARNQSAVGLLRIARNLLLAVRRIAWNVRKQNVAERLQIVVPSGVKARGIFQPRPRRFQPCLVRRRLRKSVRFCNKYLREFRVSEVPEDLKLGSTITVEAFELGDKVQVTGISKGKGFAGTVKRHNFIESRNTHGGKGVIRRVGSIGSMYPQKVFKGRKMPGRMGHDRVTVKNLVVSYIDKENNLIGLKGAVPGPKKGLIIVEGKEGNN